MVAQTDSAGQTSNIPNPSFRLAKTVDLFLLLLLLLMVAQPGTRKKLHGVGTLFRQPAQSLTNHVQEAFSILAVEHCLELLKGV